MQQPEILSYFIELQTLNLTFYKKTQILCIITIGLLAMSQTPTSTLIFRCLLDLLELSLTQLISFSANSQAQ